MKDIYQYPAEVWDKAKCEKMAKRVATDGMGTKYPFKGYLGSSACRPSTFGTELYNGGCVVNGVWYRGEHRPFPILAEGFEIVVVPTWGWRIKKK
jgi:hypothetical protein